ncbi:hypothetical protein TNCV_2243841 [Trichonephila clavipes]|nr:hypothetical protein TNCV_2243841 [Trichonephila clavipes]
MDDNVTCHRTLAVQDCLERYSTSRMASAFSDLNPIENVWDALGSILRPGTFKLGELHSEYRIIVNKNKVSTYMSVQMPSGGYNSNSLGNS